MKKVDRSEKDYILGTNDEEIGRLGLQHRVWRPRALDAWRRGGVTVGDTVLDLGCGPGFCSIDLAEIVGATGQIISIDRSRRFLDFGLRLARERRLDNIAFHELDICESDLPDIKVDAIWVRWVFCFLSDAHQVLKKAISMLKPGGTIVFHEYCCYSTFQTMPPSDQMKEFVDLVKQSWLAEGGDPDIALRLVPWLRELDLEILETRPIVDVIGSENFVWQWPITFLNVAMERLVEKGFTSTERASYLRNAIQENQRNPYSNLITPAVLEITARNKAGSPTTMLCGSLRSKGFHH